MKINTKIKLILSTLWSFLVIACSIYVLIKATQYLFNDFKPKEIVECRCVYPETDFKDVCRWLDEQFSKCVVEFNNIAPSCIKSDFPQYTYEVVKFKTEGKK